MPPIVTLLPTSTTRGILYWCMQWTQLARMYAEASQGNVAERRNTSRLVAAATGSSRGRHTVKRFGVRRIVPAALDIRFDQLRCDQLHLMAERAQQSRPMMGPALGRDRYHHRCSRRTLPYAHLLPKETFDRGVNHRFINVFRRQQTECERAGAAAHVPL
jgi:hypothetical protein